MQHTCTKLSRKRVEGQWQLSTQPDQQLSKCIITACLLAPAAKTLLNQDLLSSPANCLINKIMCFIIKMGHQSEDWHLIQTSRYQKQWLRHMTRSCNLHVAAAKMRSTLRQRRTQLQIKNQMLMNNRYRAGCSKNAHTTLCC